MLFFGVPITVEYNIESLSANLTPMTSKHTKKLYTVPKITLIQKVSIHQM